jgi:hypothetical protein
MSIDASEMKSGEGKTTPFCVRAIARVVFVLLSEDTQLYRMMGSNEVASMLLIRSISYRRI